MGDRGGLVCANPGEEGQRGVIVQDSLHLRTIESAQIHTESFSQAWIGGKDGNGSIRESLLRLTNSVNMRMVDWLHPSKFDRLFSECIVGC